MMRFLLLAYIIGLVGATPVLGAVMEHGDRILHRDKLSETSHFDDDDGDHDSDYDHDAFLGNESDEFDNLSPEESRARLAAIVDRIDTDKNGYVDTSTRMSTSSGNNTILTGKSSLKWEDYRKIVYGFLDDDQENPENEEETSNVSYEQMQSRDERRWRTADQNEDGALESAEFKFFLHPEDSDHMRDIVVTETLEDIDKDKDGKISLEEYISDMYKGESDETEPDWVKSEREQFKEFRDVNKDGFMDHDEVKNWIVPADFDHSEAEAKHLIFESDSDNDRQLTKIEILDKYDLFVGSQATDFAVYRTITPCFLKGSYVFRIRSKKQ
ncbi:Calumenin-A,Reticulocalbin-1,Calumenin-B,Calumenin,Reticulocalbin-3 [Lepeophtheirus salmonis]|uniref:Reticulocalbin-3 n=1 Tax=Lepeophtheirus salmonis TaxID=72036 RepID=A0A7R8CVS0_LEPSM|nr:Calumenin-A,Reticulocalbin-1,Calumenin-B,Calumenin,Reticulocalbin-3 [Lepeophtheirus salmonis]CAF2896594.1 Calumenin-A,Reticulocalbin-1,Calumenin-B,Calumenin,Reticulocalbin-3 [Lepeophtheirus salmonis]